MVVDENLLLPFTVNRCMDLVWEGIKLGIVLTFLIGPIFFTLIQTGVEEGLKAGLTVCTGIWISDFLYIAFVYFGVSYAAEIIENQSFTVWTGIIGSIILIAFGIGTVFSKAPFFEKGQETKRYNSYITLWLKGFLINTINPFTVFFWFSVMSTVVLAQDLSLQEAMLFFGSIMFVIIITDSLKVILSKKIRKFLKPIHVQWVRKVTGVLLVLFGIALVLRVFVLPV